MKRPFHNRRFIGILTLTAMLFVFHDKQSMAATFYVDNNFGNSAPGSGIPTDPFHLIQSAIDTALFGDTIQVAAGTYTENLVINKNHLKIVGAGKEASIIDGNHSGIVVEIRDSQEVAIEGFTIRNGSTMQTYLNGGGIYISRSNPLIVDCLIKNNGRDGLSSETTVARMGGGIYSIESSPTISRCTFENNSSLDSGGGMAVHDIWNTDPNYNSWPDDVKIIDSIFRNNYSALGGGLMFKAVLGAGHSLLDSAGLVQGCTFEANMASLGGGMHVAGQWDLTVSDSNFNQNQANSPGSPNIIQGYGGGMYLRNAGVIVKNSVFSGNSTSTFQFSEGGAVFNWHDDEVHFLESEFVNCTFRNNIANHYGGGIYNEEYASPSISNCIFYDNQAEFGGAIANIDHSTPDIRNSTIYGNTAVEGAGMYNFKGNCSPPDYTDCTFIKLYNSIVWGNTNTGAGAESITWYNDTAIDTFNSNLETPITPSSSNINTDPLFVDAASGDLHLSGSSPCRNSGNPNLLWIAKDTADLDEDGNTSEQTPHDIDGEDRASGDVDMGADEYVVPDNTTCSTPIDIQSGSYTGNFSVAAPGSDNISCVNSTDEPALWYRFTAPQDGTMIINTCGSNDLSGDAEIMDTVLSIHSDCPGTDGNSYTCNNDWIDGGSCPSNGCQFEDQGNQQLDASVCQNVTAGESYLIRVSRYAGTTGGVFQLNIGLSEPEVWVDDDWAGLQSGVDPDGDGPAKAFGYDSFATIQEGINVVSAPGTVHVYPGVYYENIELRSNIKVIGWGGNHTIIDGGRNGVVVKADSIVNAEIRYFKITHGQSSYGGGFLMNNASVKVVGCYIVDNYAYYGGGMRIVNSNPSISYCRFERNSTGNGGSGGAINNDGASPVLVYNEFFRNEATRGGAIRTWGTTSQAIISNNVFFGNQAQTGGAISNANGSRPVIENSTFLDNSATTGSSISNETSASVSILNSIIWGSDSPLSNDGSATINVSYSDIQMAAGTYSGSGNRNSDPLFEHLPHPGMDDTWGTEDDYFGDLRLQSGSPCIDSGNNNDLTLAVSLDIEYQNRRNDDSSTPDSGMGTPPIIDMGVDEHHYIASYIPKGDINSDGLINLKDVIAGLDLLTGESPSLPTTKGDVNEDEKIGMEEVLYDLDQVVNGTPTTFTNSIGMTFQLIPAGTFVMGSPDGTSEPFENPYFYSNWKGVYDEKQHVVSLSESFYMQTSEVTNKQWNDFAVDVLGGSNPSTSWTDDEYPVQNLNWYEAAAFASWLSVSEGRTMCYYGNDCTGILGEGWVCNSVTIDPTCTGYRLPTEAQWEYGARAGTETAFYSGALTEISCSFIDHLDTVAWYCGNANNTTHPVAQKEPNNWGLYDMSGNVSEWCEDWYGDYQDGFETDPAGAVSGFSRVARGGSWNNTTIGVRSATRYDMSPGWSMDEIGFRLVLPSGQNLSQQCAAEPDGYCDDGVWCNGVESCAPDTGCVDGVPVNCDDGDPCTIDHCDNDGQACINIPDCLPTWPTTM